MPVVDLYLPDDLPIAADAELGRAVARVVEAATGETAPPCAVYVHRLPVYAVMAAEVEGVRTVRVQVSCDAGPWLDLTPGIDGVVRDYLRAAGLERPTRILVTLGSVAETSGVSWPARDLRGLAG